MDGEGLVVRPYQEADRPQVEKLFEDFMDYLVNLDPLDRCRREPGFGEHIVTKTIADTAGEGLFAVAEQGGVLVGLVAGIVKRQTPEDLLDHHPSTVGWVTELYVDSKSRGSGVGHALMKAIEEHFRVNGCDASRLSVFVPNLLARQFYERSGYHERDIELFKAL